MYRFTRNIAILEIGGARIVYIRDRNANIDEIERNLGQIIFPNVAVAQQANGK